MRTKAIESCLILYVSFWLTACGGGNTPQEPAAQTAAPQSSSASSAAPPAPAKTGFQKIGDALDVWNALYAQNEKVINDYEGMPIMELVTPATTFVGSAQYDMLNPDNKDGRFEGRLLLAGYTGFVEKAGSKITFGSDRKLEKDGFGPLAKAGDRLVENGSLDLVQKYYRAEDTTERNGKAISRDLSEFKVLGDGSMICVVFNGQTINARGASETRDSAIYLHNGRNQYDFVIGEGKAGPSFTGISFADKGDMTKEQAIELFKAAGYTIDKTGGIKDGKLVVDK